MSVMGQKRKSRTTILISVKPPIAEVSLSRFDVRYVPQPDIQASAVQYGPWIEFFTKADRFP